MVTVRLAAPGEAGILQAIAREAYQRYVLRIGREPAPMSAGYAAAVRDKHGFRRVFFRKRIA
jgi:hypothetical protein